MNPDQSEQSDWGPYCLQYTLLKNMSRREEQTTKVVTGGLILLTAWMKVFRIIPEFRILRLTFLKKVSLKMLNSADNIAFLK